MVIQQQNNLSTNTQNEHLHRLVIDLNLDDVQRQHPVLAVQIGYQLDPGIRRKDQPNEDTVNVMQGKIPSDSPSTPSTPFVLLLVADGMGGQGHGQIASRLAAQSVVEYTTGSLYSYRRSRESLLSLLRASVQYTNQIVYERNRQQQTVMGTTMTAALLIGSTAYVAHVGDSRFYLSRRPAGLTQITRDHSVVAALVARGDIAPEDSYMHPRRNEIYRSLGNKASVEVDVSTVQLVVGDVLLLCSDGLWEMAPDHQIASILARPMPTPTDIAQALIQAALAGGGKDNVSAIVARVCTN
jgi:serine/threonine protein phosphatase PrpC